MSSKDKIPEQLKEAGDHWTLWLYRPLGYMSSPRMILGGLLFTFLAIIYLPANVGFWVSGVDATATVQRVENRVRRDPTGKNRATHHYQVVWFQYQTPDGSWFEGHDEVGHKEYRPGNPIAIQWLRDEPSRVRILGNDANFMFWCNVALAGFCFTWRVILWPFRKSELITISPS